MVLLAGCRSAPYNRLDIIDYRASGAQSAHYEDFEEAYYRVSGDGRADIVLRKKVASQADPTEDIVQMVRLHTYWRSRPGRTFAEESMLNTTISYVLERGSSWIGYEGGGFADYRHNPKKGLVKGKLEGGHLQPSLNAGEDLTIFEKATISGRFRAVRNERRATRIINEMQRLLGPAPRIEPGSRSPDY